MFSRKLFHNQPWELIIFDYSCMSISEQGTVRCFRRRSHYMHSRKLWFLIVRRPTPCWDSIGLLSTSGSPRSVGSFTHITRWWRLLPLCLGYNVFTKNTRSIQDWFCNLSLCFSGSLLSLPPNTQSALKRYYKTQTIEMDQISKYISCSILFYR